MLVTAALSLVIAAQSPATDASKAFFFDGVGGEGVEKRLWLNIPLNRRDPAKISPKHGWEFPFMMAGYTRPKPDVEQYELRFRVYAQHRKEQGDVSPSIARALLRMWDYNLQMLRLDHAIQYNNRVVDVYLCYGGTPGGEQRFDIETDGDRERKVNTIYIYQIDTLTQPIEMLREVAHEYGHATLPPIGGFQSPEDWANGYLGEKLFLRYFRNELAAKRLTPDDVFGVTAGELNTWVKRNVDPLVVNFGTSGPDAKMLKSIGQNAMDHYMGMVLYCQEILPWRTFARSLVLTGSTNAVDYPNGLVLAMQQLGPVEITVPSSLAGKSMWVPVGDGRLTGGKVLSRRGNWAEVQPSAKTMKVSF